MLSVDLRQLCGRPTGSLWWFFAVKIRVSLCLGVSVVKSPSDVASFPYFAINQFTLLLVLLAFFCGHSSRSFLRSTFRYHGEKFAERQGTLTGTVSVWDFNQLARFIKDSGYMDLSDTYHRSITDNPTVFTMVEMNDQRKVISDYAQAGPSKLWAIERLTDDLLVQAHWNEPLPQAGQK